MVFHKQGLKQKAKTERAVEKSYFEVSWLFLHPPDDRCFFVLNFTRAQPGTQGFLITFDYERRFGCPGSVPKLKASTPPLILGYMCEKPFQSLENS